ncbi:unnamed protein product [Lepeophtheirus salmonis]|uniref:(salmon louse) hypothetical protein n=1 Tax=Lepeophtheirus salmonis TaxID=72036 RepID=A0A7R8CLJ0_LEPSM|nr:unnamed protein product [Lepeophtheirus salmonis]CAF2853164.1 unnamed protein product [Lepeophtheirus salmonis]
MVTCLALTPAVTKGIATRTIMSQIQHIIFQCFLPYLIQMSYVPWMVAVTDNHHCSMSVSTTLVSVPDVEEVYNYFVQLVKWEAITYFVYPTIANIFNSPFFFVCQALIIEYESDNSDDVGGGVSRLLSSLTRKNIDIHDS